MRLLITGGTGFIGTHLAQITAARGIETVVCSQPRPDRQSVAGKVIGCNLWDPESVQNLITQIRPTHIVHLAWCARGGYLTSPDNIRWLAATQELVHRFASCAGIRFVGIGTCFEYGTTALPCSEFLTPTLPQTLYGKAKLACGNALAALSEVYNISAAWCRLFYILGPGEAGNRLVPSLSRAARLGETFVCRNKDAVADYMDVRDVAAAIADVLTSDLTGVINIGSGEGVRIQELIELFRIVTSVPLAVDYAGEQQAGSITASVSRLAGELGFQREYSLEKSLVDCYESN